MIRMQRTICLLLGLLLLTGSLAGCTPSPAPAQTDAAASTAASHEDSAPASTDAAATPSEETPDTEPTGAEPDGTDRGPMPENAVSWREVFWDKGLPANGYLGPNEVAFYLTDEQGENSVLLMTCGELLDRVAAMGALPRTHFFEDMLDDRFTVLFACFDLAIELGCRKFCFPTRDLRGGDIAAVKHHISYTFSVINGDPQYSATKDYRDGEGREFHYMTVQLTHFNAEDVQKYVEAITEAKRIVNGIPAGLDEAETAEYLYRYVASTVEYNYDNYYEETDWSTLYDALILRSTVCTGYAEALYCLFNLAGIDCLYLSGSVSQDHVVDFHAWNEAKINGVWYIFDATWDSNLLQMGLLGEKLAFFGLSDAASDAFAVRKPWPFMASVAPVCSELLDPDNPLESRTEEP